jgi:hypothetical protein
MQRPGVDPDHVQMTDILCDFCHRPWTEDEPMVEGHRGSCICGRCLTVAYTEIIAAGGGEPNEARCVMCLEDERDRTSAKHGGEPCWRSPVHESAVICRRCIDLAASALHKDRDFAWTRPETETR